MKRKSGKTHIKILSINVRARKKLIAFFIAFLLFIIGILTYMKFLVNPIIIATSESKIITLANKSMNIAVTQAMERNISYDDLIHIVTDSKGSISMIQANSVQINAMSKQISRTIQQNLILLTKEPITIPIGSFTGIPILSGLGPKIKFQTFPYGNISCRFASKFESAGINQTHHKIFMNITTNVHVVLPLNNLIVKTGTEVLVCESVIIGDIPTTYLRSTSLDEMLNLVPM